MIPKGVRQAFEKRHSQLMHWELDRCHGSSVLRRPSLRRIVTESLEYFHGQRVWTGDYVVMPNHVHAILQPFDGWELESLIESIKKWTSRQIRRDEHYPNTDIPEATSKQSSRRRLWQRESYDRIIRDVYELSHYRVYIANNPGAARLREGEWSYHAAEWLDAFASIK